MEWLKITAPKLREYVASGKAVAVVPCGSMEKHGEHLPLGTDTLNVEYICRAACEKSGTLMLPVMPYLFVNEMKASVGAVSLSARTILTLLHEVCDEISRNGVKKIVFVNGHGGNNNVLGTFLQDLPGLGRDYAVYNVFLMRLGFGTRFEKAKAMTKTTLPEGHAGDKETDLTMFTNRDCVDLCAIGPDESAGASMLDYDVSPARDHIGWYASFPDSLSGDPRFPSAERGRELAESIMDNLADNLVRIRDDEKVAGRCRSFEMEARDPKKMR